METETKVGYLVLDSGFEYNDDTYDTGRGGASVIGHAVFGTVEDAKRALRFTAKDTIERFEIGMFDGFEWGDAEPAIEFARYQTRDFPEFPTYDTWRSSSYTYEKFFQDCGRIGVDWLDYLPRIWQIIQVELGDISILISVPDDQITAAKEGLADIHESLSQ